jgi:pentatricopeptide repeat protein
MYVKCLRIEEGCDVFDNMSERDTVAWTGMIARYAQNEYSDETLDLFGQMLQTHIKLDDVTLVTVLST